MHWCRCPSGCYGFPWPPSLVRANFDRHRSGRRKYEPGNRATPLTERRCLELVSRGVSIEQEALRFRSALQAVEMGIEIGDPLIGIKLHRLLEIAHPNHSSTADKKRASPRTLRAWAAVPKP